jgi:hypothetical protein
VSGDDGLDMRSISEALAFATPVTEEGGVWAPETIFDSGQETWSSSLREIARSEVCKASLLWRSRG